MELEVTIMEGPEGLHLHVTGARPLLDIFRNKLGKMYLAQLYPFVRRRTDRQNRYVWGVVVPTVQAWFRSTTGEKRTKDEVYYFLRSLVGDRLVIQEIGGMEVPVLSGKTFSQMTTEEYSDAIELIYRHFAEKGLTIPPPVGECLYSDYTR